MKSMNRLHQLQMQWDQSYPDVPWIAQRLFVPLDAAMSSHAFEFVFEGVMHIPVIELAWKSDQEPARHGPEVETNLISDGTGLVLRLMNFDSSQLQGFWIQQSAPIRHANLVCLQRDPLHGDWVVVYNSIERSKKLQQEISTELQGTKYIELRQFIDALLNRDIKKAEVMLETNASLLAQITEQNWISAKFSLEHVLHGLKKTFRYWTEEEKKLYLQEALQVIDALRPLSVDACIFGGAALGWARQSQLLNHDDDLDVIICLDKKRFPDIAIALEAVTQTLSAAGWKIPATFFSQLWVSTKSEVAPSLDVFIGLVEEDGISCYPMPRRALKHDQLFPAQLCPLHGLKVPMPRNLEHYFEVDYGPNWKTPSPNYSIEWDRSPYVDIAGIRKKIPNSTRREIAFMRKIAWIL